MHEEELISHQHDFGPKRRHGWHQVQNQEIYSYAAHITLSPDVIFGWAGVRALPHKRFVYNSLDSSRSYTKIDHKNLFHDWRV